MRKIYTLFIALLSLICSVDVVAQTWEWTTEAPGSNKKVYIRNKVVGTWIQTASTSLSPDAWITDNTVTAAGLFTLEGSSTYKLKNANGKYLTWDIGSLKTGNNSGQSMTFSTSDNSYKIYYDGWGDYYLYLTGTNPNATLTKSDNKNSGSDYWQLITSDQISTYVAFNNLKTDHTDASSYYAITIDGQVKEATMKQTITSALSNNNKYIVAGAKSALETNKTLLERYIDVYNEIQNPQSDDEHVTDDGSVADAWAALQKAANNDGLDAVLSTLYLQEKTPELTVRASNFKPNQKVNLEDIIYTTSPCDYTITSDNTKKEIAEIKLDEDGKYKLFTYRLGTVTLTFSQKADKSKLWNGLTQDFVITVEDVAGHVPFDVEDQKINHNGYYTIDIIGAPKSIGFKTSTDATTNVSWTLEESSEDEPTDNSWTSTGWSSNENSNDLTGVNEVPLKPTTKHVRFHYTGRAVIVVVPVDVEGNITDIHVSAASADGSVTFNNQETKVFYTNTPAQNYNQTYTFKHANANGALKVESSNAAFKISDFTSPATGYDISGDGTFNVQFAVPEFTEEGNMSTTITVSDKKSALGSFNIVAYYGDITLTKGDCPTDIFTTSRNNNTISGKFTHKNVNGNISATSSDSHFTVTLNQKSKNSFVEASEEDFTISYTLSNAWNNNETTSNHDHNAIITFTAGDKTITYDIAAHYRTTGNVSITLGERGTSIITGDAADENNVVSGSFTHKNCQGDITVTSSDSENFTVNYEQKSKNSFLEAGVENYTITFNPKADGEYKTTIIVAGSGQSKTYEITAKYMAPHVVAPSAVVDHWSTLYLPCNARIPKDAKAYTGKLDGNVLTLEEITNGYIPANTGVVIKATKDVTFELYNGSVDAIPNNDLKGTNTATETSSIKEKYPNNAVCVLSIADEKVGFYNFIGTQLAANKAYLLVPTTTQDSQAKAIRLALATPTGIEVIGEASIQSVATYNLAGQRVKSSAKGLIIKGGKKFINK